MSQKTDMLFATLRQKSVLFVGIGVTNTPIIKLFATKGIRVTVCDRKTREQLGETYDEIASWGAKMLVGDDYPDRLEADIVFRAPGVYFHSPLISDARKNGSVVTSDLEMFFDYCDCPIYGVTGSEGKTTTTTLISELLKRQGKCVHLGGNIGKCLFSQIESVSHSDVAVVELSSFQLLSMRSSPDVAVLTNITPNHLDVHGTMDEYIDSKKNVFLHQSAFGRCVLNADNELTASFAPQVRGEVVFFSHEQKPGNCVFLRDGAIWISYYGTETRIVDTADILIPGIHNVEDFMAAFAAVWGKVSVENMVWVAKNFKGVEHRQELVRVLDGVKYYNDSIATTPTRTNAALNTFGANVVLIAGGYDKKIPFDSMVEPLLKAGKALILTGATADKIEAAVTAHPDYDAQKLPIHRVDCLADAVAKARELAVEGDIVTLSPACASFDCYPNFEARGIDYKNMVNALK
ncbi:MAG: UDP-N-acetylmuramoyl-L-alanine--D-glutamate ligase [Clostridia bacterium]|nr:UDP-N-acetylmuramoyl-L-alanine--D-glutamate ligase [Clostridia bacterium]